MTDALTKAISSTARDAAAAHRREAALELTMCFVDQIRTLGLDPVIDAVPAGGINIRLALDPETLGARREPLIEAWLDGLGYGDGWTPRLDFLLSHGVLQGDSMARIARVLRMDVTACRRRHEALRGHGADQQRFFEVLARRAGVHVG